MSDIIRDSVTGQFKSTGDKPPMKPTSIKIPLETKEKLTNYCQEKGISVSAFVVSAIEEKLAKELKGNSQQPL